MNHLESLYRRQQPRTHPLRDDHDYTQYLNQQKALRDEAAENRRQEMGGAEFEAHMAYDGYQMPSANLIMKSQSLQNQRVAARQDPLVTPPDQKYANSLQGMPQDPSKIIGAWTPQFKNEMPYNRQNDPADIDSQVSPMDPRR